MRGSAARVSVVPEMFITTKLDGEFQLNPGVTRIAQREYNAAHGIVAESWSPFGGGGAELLTSPVITSLAERLGRTPGQVVLRWHIKLGLVAIPKSATPARLAANLDAFDFVLSAEDLLEIAVLDGGPDAGVDSDVTGH